MNIQEYIESGIVGSYVLGLASEVEQQEFESLCIQFPELVKAKKAFELALEAQLIKEAVAPPAGMKEKISMALNNHNSEKQRKPENEYNTTARKIHIWKWVTAASILLLAGSVYFTYSTRDKYQKLQRANIELKNTLNGPDYTNPLKALNPIAKKPSVKWSAMLEPADSSHCMAHIYWDSASKNTFLLVGNIPQNVADKQFQLWALLNNHPVNLGSFDTSKEGQLLQMRDVHKAKVFIITIEPKGGSATPTMKAIYAIGKL